MKKDGAGVVNELVRTTTQEKKRKEIQMNSSSNLLVLGATGQVGKLVAKNLKRRKANFSVGSRREANLEELADQFGASRFIDLDDPTSFDALRANISETLPVVVINEQGGGRENKDEQESSWCCLRGRGWRGTKRRRA